MNFSTFFMLMLLLLYYVNIELPVNLSVYRLSLEIVFSVLFHLGIVEYHSQFLTYIAFICEPVYCMRNIFIFISYFVGGVDC